MNRDVLKSRTLDGKVYSVIKNILKLLSMKWVLKEPNCVENLWVFDIIRSNERLSWKFYYEIQIHFPFE